MDIFFKKENKEKRKKNRITEIIRASSPDKSLIFLRFFAPFCSPWCEETCVFVFENTKMYETAMKWVQQGFVLVQANIPNKRIQKIQEKKTRKETGKSVE